MAEFEPRSLHLHTLDSLLADLVSGRPVLVDGKAFSLEGHRARSGLQWYRQRGQHNWSAPVSVQHGEDLVNAILGGPPEVAALPAPPADANARRLTLKRMEVHASRVFTNLAHPALRHQITRTILQAHLPFLKDAMARARPP